MKTDISGFPEFLPNEQIAFNHVKDIIQSHFESYGFVPMDTPAVERIDTLLAKGNDSEIYGIYRLADENSKKSLGLRFDLTVPFARYVAAYHGEMVFPHKRYQIAPVWRGERPQSGRYRQFYQCDIDVIAENKLSLEHDAEVLMLITETLRDIGVPAFTTRINNRKLLMGFLSHIMDGGSAEEEQKSQKIVECIRLIDKREKISSEEFWGEIKQFEILEKGVEELRAFLDIGQKGESNEEILGSLKQMKVAEISGEFAAGINELETIVNLLTKCSISDNCLKISTSLARGLAYYTGTVLETTLDDFKDIGSVCGGGRYDNLTAMIAGNNKNFVGVGASIGISRLVPKLIEKGIIPCEQSTTAQFMVAVQDRRFLAEYMEIAKLYRKIGIKTEIYLQDKSLGNQLSYASRKGINFVIIANEAELAEGKINLRDLINKTQITVDINKIRNDLKKVEAEKLPEDGQLNLKKMS